MPVNRIPRRRLARTRIEFGGNGAKSKGLNEVQS
jgi:hypothetical protein